MNRAAAAGERPVAMITGANGGIGTATTAEFKRSGWRVVELDVKGSERAASDLQLIVDVRDRDAIDRAVDTAVAKLGRLDAFVNNAGVQRHAAFEEVSQAVWSEVLDINLNGTFHCMQSAGRRMLDSGYGAIVNVVSVAAERGQAGRSPYAASKAAIVSLTKTAAVEWASRGVRVNAIGPGYVDTQLVRNAIREGAIDSAPFLARTPLGRMAQPEEIARAIRFLASDDAAFVTGQVLYVDGGFLADFGVPWNPANGN